jgi:hypothetical protein
MFGIKGRRSRGSMVNALDLGVQILGISSLYICRNRAAGNEGVQDKGV